MTGWASEGGTGMRVAGVRVFAICSVRMVSSSDLNISGTARYQSGDSIYHRNKRMNLGCILVIDLITG